MVERRTVWAIGAVVLVVLAISGSYKLMNSRSFQVFGQLTHRVDTDRKVVALTFDDGPTCADVDAVMGGLGEVKATFFLNGQPISACRDGARRLVNAGHEIGNHTWDHRRMVLILPDAVAHQMEPTDAAIREAGFEGEILIRPPYGKKLVVFPWWLSQHGRHTITWDVAAETFGDGPPQDAQTIASSTVSSVRPGSIILLHPWNGRTESQKAIAKVIAELQAQGYEFVTVSELLAA